jgi:hypothetical protein
VTPRVVGFSSSEKNGTSADVCIPNPPPNAAPVVNAGADKMVGITFGATMTGSATDDGNPMPPNSISLLWTQDSGPGTSTFVNNTSATTEVTFDVVGTYVLRLTASDGLLESADTVSVNVDTSFVIPTYAPLGQPLEGSDIAGAGFSQDGQTLGVGLGFGISPSKTVYDFNGSTWVQRPGTVFAGDIRVFSFSGNNTVAVGIADTISVFDYIASDWVQRGSSVNANLLYTGEHAVMAKANPNIFVATDPAPSGLTTVYIWNGSSWVTRGTVPFGGSGCDISNSGDVFVVGRTFQIKVFAWNGTTYIERVLIPIMIQYNIIAISGNGNSVCLSNYYDTGAVFDWNGSTWIQRGSVIIFSSGPNRFASISGNGNTIAFSADDLGTEMEIWNWNSLTQTWIRSFLGARNGFLPRFNETGSRVAVAGDLTVAGPTQVLEIQ